MAFHDGVASDKVYRVLLAHFLEQLLREGHLLVARTSINRNVVRHDVHELGLRTLQLTKRGNRSPDITLLACGANEPHVISDATAF
eukprot:CAMPEP_0115487874 /NCGR_PEP_ID=MMETSP0271-20121206/61179_1 /TAXON_ID=71861 /ORGANISM="Scrippsiella trochoidea, Strain CCMP3099" /LENGTH=85 /DNA_ID=CAMNT_0002915935 /DNA_START=311 /DNA_END=565 /DNA_ORIENTATION=+